MLATSGKCRLRSASTEREKVLVAVFLPVDLGFRPISCVSVIAFVD